MLLKKFLKNRADDEKEEEVSLEELQERKIRLVRSIQLNLYLLLQRTMWK